MKLAEVEKHFGVTFPKKFHEIYETGAMEYLELTLGEFQKVRDKYTNDPKAFLMMNGDCEPLFFEEISERSEELKEWLSWRAGDEGEMLREGIKLVPFAQTGRGDLYLFVYESGTEPKIVLYRHDDFEEPELCGRDFDEFLYYAMLDALQWDEDMMNGDTWHCHLNYLSDEYRAKITGKSVEESLEVFEDLGNDLDRNAIAIFEEER